MTDNIYVTNGLRTNNDNKEVAAVMSEIIAMLLL